MSTNQQGWSMIFEKRDIISEFHPKIASKSSFFPICILYSHHYELSYPNFVLYLTKNIANFLLISVVSSPGFYAEFALILACRRCKRGEACIEAEGPGSKDTHAPPLSQEGTIISFLIFNNFSKAYKIYEDLIKRVS
jgi:hypothetical protein